MKFEGTQRYVATDDLRMAVNAAVALQRPLLIKGEPGTGKTMLAEEVALGLGKRLIQWHIKSTTKAQQGLYEYDAVSRLRDSQLGDAKVHDIANYIKRGKLWDAFDADEQVVLLIDEVDKADIEFPNDLLVELDRMEFFVYETGQTIRARHRPIIIITSNNEKELPDAFLRRCFFHFIKFPDRDTMREIVAVHYPAIARELVQEALQPGHALCVQVVGGLVQQDHVRVGQQQPAQGHPPALAARQGRHIGVPGWQAQGVRRHLQPVVQVVGVGRLDDRLQPRLFLGQGIEIRIRFRVIRVHLLQAGQGVHRLLQPLLHVAAHILVRVELRLLGQIAYLDPRLRPRLPQDIRIDARHDAQQRRLARAVQAQHADLGAGEKRQGNIFQDFFLGRHDLANPVHGENVLGHFLSSQRYSGKSADSSRTNERME